MRFTNAALTCAIVGVALASTGAAVEAAPSLVVPASGRAAVADVAEARVVPSRRRLLRGGGKLSDLSKKLSTKIRSGISSKIGNSLPPCLPGQLPTVDPNGDDESDEDDSDDEDDDKKGKGKRSKISKTFKRLFCEPTNTGTGTTTTTTNTGTGTTTTNTGTTTVTTTTNGGTTTTTNGGTDSTTRDGAETTNPVQNGGDGDTSTVDPGTRINRDGTTTQINGDGTTTTTSADGSTTVTNRDGSTTTTAPDGSRTTSAATGGENSNLNEVFSDSGDEPEETTKTPWLIIGATFGVAFLLVALAVYLHKKSGSSSGSHRGGNAVSRFQASAQQQLAPNNGGSAQMGGGHGQNGMAAGGMGGGYSGAEPRMTRSPSADLTQTGFQVIQAGGGAGMGMPAMRAKQGYDQVSNDMVSGDMDEESHMSVASVV